MRDDFATPYHRPRHTVFSTICLYLTLFSIVACTALVTVAMAKKAAYEKAMRDGISYQSCEGQLCHSPDLTSYGKYRKYWGGDCGK